ncbi:MAG: TRAP transporter small permease subunit [Gammaproteobacteria bacterium]|jgi:TRAP-type C4-dicarboxylate transport system permease small subunit
MKNKSDRTLLARVLTIVHGFEDSLLAMLLIAMILLAGTQILLRNVFETSLVWADPLLRITVLWAALLGALAASRDNKHITIDVLTRVMNEKARQATRIFTSLFTAVVTGIIAYHAGRFVIMEHESRNLVLGIPAWIFEAIIPLAFGLMAIRYLIHFVQCVQILFAPRQTS